jgi:glycosyltransferase 2 family protein
MARRRAWWQWAARLVGPLILVAVIWRLEHKAEIAAALLRVDGVWMTAAILLNVPVIHVKVWRWRLLLPEAPRYGLGRSYVAVLSSLYLGMVTPGRVGDAIRIQYLKHDLGTPYPVGLAVTLMDRFCDLWALGAFVFAGCWALGGVLRADLLALSLVAAAGAIAGPILLLVPGAGRIVVRGLRGVLSRWQMSAEALLTSLRGLTRRGVVLGLPLTLCAYAIGFAQAWLVARALGMPLSFVHAAALLAITSLLGLAPISISGLGVRELCFSLVFPALGFAAADGVSVGLLVFAAIYAAAVVPGFIAWQLSPPPFDASPSARPPDVPVSASPHHGGVPSARGAHTRGAHTRGAQ